MAARLQIPARMPLPRVFVVCFLGIYFCLLWREVMGPSQVAVTVEFPAAVAGPPGEGAVPAPRPAPVVNVIDVAAAAATPELVAQLLRIAPDERIVSLDDRPVVDNVAAGARLADRFEGDSARGAIARGDHLDVTLMGASGSRRVLVLFH